MKMKISSYGGAIGFELRKKIPRICSKAFLILKRKQANKISKEFIDRILEEKEIYPSIVSIETINRCNGNCSFCGCNKEVDERKFKIMEKNIFEKIIQDLKYNQFDGVLMIVMNNEPFMDKEIIKKLEYSRNQLPKAKMKLISNGSLILKEQFEYINKNKLLDELIINNYNTTMKLNNNIQKLYDEFKNQDLNFLVKIDIRYSGEILSNRANTSPNSKGEKIIKDFCTLPYTDFNINPYGIATLCCCDAKEKTNFGNIKNQTISEIFNSQKYKEVRRLMKNGRNKYDFCKFCDFIDRGMRLKEIKRKNGV